MSQDKITFIFPGSILKYISQNADCTINDNWDNIITKIEITCGFLSIAVTNLVLVKRQYYCLTVSGDG